MAVIAVCYPSGDMLKAGFCLDLVCMVGAFVKRHAGVHTVHVINAQLSVLPKSRMMLVQEAMKHDATHILFLDSDARFTTDTLDRLLAHDLDFVACNAVRRALPCTPTSSNGPGHMIWTMPEESYGLEEVHDHVGLHTALIKMDVFKAVPQPWFMMPWLIRQQEYQGEDVWFCHRAIDAGFRIWVDHDLSLGNRHSGNFDYDHRLAALGRKEYEEEAARVRAETLAKEAAEKPTEGDIEFVEPMRSPVLVEYERL